MTTLRIIGVLCMSCLLPFLSSEILFAQLSPGQLTKAHAELEGLSNCTKCHTLGDKVENAKCLECHTEIQSRITAGRGFHVSSDVRNQDCFKCHSEHHGRTFEMIRFDTEHFDHKTTGFALTGAHTSLDCAECHQQSFIKDKDPRIRRNPDTYLGLGTECVSCHTDFHQGTLSNSCTQCHTTDAFVPASGFQHEDTEFPLRGAHKQVDCASCHQVTTRNGSSFQQFAGVAFTNCSSCHQDPHSGRFGSNCKECHVEESFHLFRGMENFNHNKTGFPLNGQHRSVSCASCHDTKVATQQMFKDFVNRDVSNCTACHEDVHESKFGVDCRSCHSEQSFRSVSNFTTADHEKTDFPLRGQHQTVDCRKCHDTRMTEPLAFGMCINCHDDFHEGQFVTAVRQPDCAECHTVDGFASSTFSIDRHNVSQFPLEGAHLATPCFACHLRDDRWAFRDIGGKCVDCHEDIHAGSIEIQYYPDQDCARCHNPETWRDVQFEHTLTGWPLEGKHESISCVQCHLPVDEPVHQVLFTGLTPDCASCHDNVHRAQFERNGITDCTRCHSPAHWKPSSFDHDSARFALEGAHVNVACTKCHTPVSDVAGSYVLYRTDKLNCVDCHQ